MVRVRHESLRLTAGINREGYRHLLGLHLGESESEPLLQSYACMARLVDVKAFFYENEAGQISVRLERKGRGSEAGHWVVYKRYGDKLRKSYICEVYALDPHNLDQAAQHLLAQRRKASKKHDTEGDNQ